MTARPNCEDCAKPADLIVRDYSRGWVDQGRPICHPCLTAIQADEADDPYGRWQDPQVIARYAPEPTVTDPITYYRDLEQRSTEWLNARCGLVTASAIGKLLSVSAPGADTYACPECGASAGLPCVSLRNGVDIKTLHSGRYTIASDNAADAAPIFSIATGDTARRSLLGLAAERITGHVEETPISSAMWRGIEDEPHARAAYVTHHAQVDESVGFITRDIGGPIVGYSPDGLVGDDGLIEIKSRSQAVQVSHVLSGHVPAENMAQLQTGLFVTGRAWIDYISYSTGMALWVKRVWPIPAWQDAIEKAARHAEEEITGITTRYQAATQRLPMTERVDHFAEIEIPA